MSDVIALVQRAERLQGQVEVLRQELNLLRKDLQRLVPTPASGPDCLAVALALADDLGPDVSSDDPHGFTERGTDWFEEP